LIWDIKRYYTPIVLLKNCYLSHLLTEMSSRC
jgi:hypothetical protein